MTKRRAKRSIPPRAQHKKDGVKDHVKAQDSQLAKMVTLGEQAKNAKLAQWHMKIQLQTLPAGKERDLVLENVETMEVALCHTVMEKKLAWNRVCHPPPMMQQKAQSVIVPLACPASYQPMIMIAPGTSGHFNVTLHHVQNKH